jgi:hypothetical protein
MSRGDQSRTLTQVAGPWRLTRGGGVIETDPEKIDPTLQSFSHPAGHGNVSNEAQSRYQSWVEETVE